MTAESHRHTDGRWPALPVEFVRPHGSQAHQTAGAADHSDALVIECDRCTMRGIGCGDCVVTVLLGGPPYGVELDDAERHAIGVLADAGLVPPLRMVEAVDPPCVDGS